jgi:hypothetical protein
MYPAIFWLCIFFIFIMSCWTISALLILSGGSGKLLLNVFSIGYVGVAVIFYVSITIRRLHDAGLSGWYLLYGSQYELFCKTDPKANKYGQKTLSKANFKALFGF